jgi:flagellar biosynthesis GTPase FlhF
MSEKFDISNVQDIVIIIKKFNFMDQLVRFVYDIDLINSSTYKQKYSMSNELYNDIIKTIQQNDIDVLFIICCYIYGKINKIKLYGGANKKFINPYEENTNEYESANWEEQKRLEREEEFGNVVNTYDNDFVVSDQENIIKDENTYDDHKTEIENWNEQKKIDRENELKEANELLKERKQNDKLQQIQEKKKKELDKHRKKISKKLEKRKIDEKCIIHPNTNVLFDSLLYKMFWC